MLIPRKLFAGLFSLGVLLVGTGAFAGAAPKPSIASIQAGANDLSTVVVHVPKGTKRVTLQLLEAKKWVTRAIAHVDGSGNDVTFQVPHGTPKNRLRVTGSSTDPLPTSFFQGQTNFATASTGVVVSSGQSSSGAGAVSLASGGAQTGNSSSFSGGSLSSVASSSNGSSLSTAQAQPTPVESDIWEIEGDTLYFFNQYRGLQIIDLSVPGSPTLLGDLSLPAVGEQMYLLDSNHLVLLARKSDSWGESEVISVALDSKKRPSISARIPVFGSIDTSRMVGAALYVASEGYRSVINNLSYLPANYGSQLTSVDFSNPSAPVVSGSIWQTGYGEVTTVSGNYLLVAKYADWTHSSVSIYDISAGNGTMVLSGSLSAAGVVKDKFKMAVNGDVVTVISEIWPSWNQGQWRQGESKLETFSISQGFAKLGEVSFGQGDWLYGSLINGQIAYVVTATAIDPLWVVDLSDPTKPQITGKLEVPGRSTYLKSLGNQLITIGWLNHQVAVSLFDVANPAAPALLSQVSVGGSNSWTSSEATWDEKAFSVLPEAGLALVPVNSWNWQSGEANQVQLIDIGANSLTKRGVINASFSPRRATQISKRRLLAISGRELLTINDRDRDNPTVENSVSLAWPVNQVFVQGQYLLEVEAGGGWWSQSAPVIRVALASDPDSILTETQLPGSPICGATVRGQKLYVAQASPSHDAKGNPKTQLAMEAFDLSALPQLAVASTTAAAQVDSLGWSSSLKALWLNDQTLVWVTRPNGSPFICYAQPVFGTAPISGGFVLAANANQSGASSQAILSPGGVTDSFVSSSNLCIAYPYFWQRDAYLFAFDVHAPSKPLFLGQTKFASNPWSLGEFFVSGNLIFTSHWGAWKSPSSNPLAGGGGPLWVQGWSLDVIDFSSPSAPVLRDPVSISNQLVGISNGSTEEAILYTQGTRKMDLSSNEWNNLLDASAYDGVSAALIDSVKIPSWSSKVSVSGSTVLVGHASTSGSSGVIDSWRLGSSGKLELVGSTPLEPAPDQMHLIDSLLVTHSSVSTNLFDVTQPATLKLIGTKNANLSIWPNLDGSSADDRGVWIPLNDYGVDFINANP